MLGAMIRGNGSSPSCRAASGLWAARRWTTGCLWRRCCIATEPGFPGGICRSGLGMGKTCLGVGAAGPKVGSGKRVSSAWPERLRTSTRCSTARWCVLTNPARARKKEGESQALGRSKGGWSTKMHATVDALGHPTGFLLTPGPACDWEGADALRPALEAPTVMADKGYDAD